MTEGARERLEGEAIFFADRNTAFRSQDAAEQHATDLRELLARLSRYEAALRRIADWDLPPSGEFYPNADGSVSDRPAPYDSFYAFGSLGGQQAIRHIALAALSDGESHE